MTKFGALRAVALAGGLLAAGSPPVAGSLPASAAGRAYDADVLIQAGHEGRPDCNVEPASLCRNTGAIDEMPMNESVANQATRLLQAAGFKVLRKAAYLQGVYHVRDAIFIHFDGSVNPCTVRASVGYPNVAHSQEAAQQWKRLYARAWHWGYQADNYADSLRHYYGYKHIVVSDAALLIEGGEITCPPQSDWIRNHIDWEAEAIAYLVSQRLHKGNLRPPLR